MDVKGFILFVLSHGNLDCVFLSDSDSCSKMPTVKGDGMRGLAVFISDIRNCKRFIDHRSILWTVRGCKWFC